MNSRTATLTASDQPETVKASTRLVLVVRHAVVTAVTLVALVPRLSAEHHYATGSNLYKREKQPRMLPHPTTQGALPVSR